MDRRNRIFPRYERRKKVILVSSENKKRFPTMQPKGMKSRWEYQLIFQKGGKKEKNITKDSEFRSFLSSQTKMKILTANANKPYMNDIEVYIKNDGNLSQFCDFKRRSRKNGLICCGFSLVCGFW